MATIFSAPQIGDPRATGIKNGGIKAFESDIVYPVSRLTTRDGTWSGGKQLEFRWRSDSSRFWSPRDTKLYVKYKVGFGPKNSYTIATVTLVDECGVSKSAGDTIMQNAHAVEGVLLEPLTSTDKVVKMKITKGAFDNSNAIFFGSGGEIAATSGGGSNYANVDESSTAGSTASGNAVDLSSSGGKKEVRNVRITAAPNTSLFDGGVRYLQNSVVVENQTQPYSACMAQLLTKTDVAGTDTGVAGMLSLRKDVGKMLKFGDVSASGADTVEFGQATVTSTSTSALTTLAPFEDGLKFESLVPEGTTFDLNAIKNIDLTALGNKFTAQDPNANGTNNSVVTTTTTSTTSGTQTLPGHEAASNGDNKFDNTNPKQEILTLGSGTFEIAEPLFLASWQHGYAVGPSDHQLFLTINPNYLEDLLHCPAVGSAGVRDYTQVKTMPAGGMSAAGFTPEDGCAYVFIDAVEMHVSYVSPAQAFIPPSQSLRFSQYQVTTRQIQGTTNIQESIVVPPGVRQVLVGLRQNKHGIQYDREELSKAGAGINEIPGANNTGYDSGKLYWWQDFQLQLGSAIAPTVAFSQMDPTEGSMARAYNEFLSVIGKPLGMRGNTLTYADYLGVHSCNGPSGASKGDHGPVIALRLLTPDSSLSNNLQIRGTLTTSGGGSGPSADVLQEMVVIVVSDSLLDVQYAPPTEIPVSTAVNALV